MASRLSFNLKVLSLFLSLLDATIDKYVMRLVLHIQLVARENICPFFTCIADNRVMQREGKVIFINIRRSLLEESKPTFFIKNCPACLLTHGFHGSEQLRRQKSSEW